jgi:hypothetical protein
MTTAGIDTDTERAFAFLRLNERPQKPRARGVTEIRGPYYTSTPAARLRSCRVRPCGP